MNFSGFLTIRNQIPLILIGESKIIEQFLSLLLEVAID